MRFTCSYVLFIKKIIESGTLVSGMSKLWEETNVNSKKYRCSLAIYLMTVLSYSYGIITDRAINEPGNENNFVDGINATGKRYLK